MSTKVKKEIRKHIRWIDGTLLSSPRFPNTRRGREAADRWLAEKRTEKNMLKAGFETQAREIPFITWAAIWIEDQKKEHPAATWMDYDSRLRNHILPVFGSRMLHTIKRPEIVKFLRSLLNKGLHPTTVNHIRVQLHKIFVDAMAEDPPYVKENPVSGIKPIAKYDTKKRPNVYSLEECEAYLEAAKEIGPDVYILIMFFLNTGARTGEIIALQHQDISLEYGSFTIRRVIERRTGLVKPRPKGKRERTLGINSALRAAYKDWVKKSTFTAPEDWVCHRFGKGDRWTHAAISYWHRKIVQKAKLRYIRPHDLRHTYASLYIMNGGSKDHLQGVLGHVSPSTTERYTHFLPGFLEKQAKWVEVGGTKRKKVKRKQ